MDVRIKYLYIRILKLGFKFRNNKHNHYYPKTIIEELDLYEHPHNGDWVDVWQFDLAKPEADYVFEPWPDGTPQWKYIGKLEAINKILW